MGFKRLICVSGTGFYYSICGWCRSNTVCGTWKVNADGTLGACLIGPAVTPDGYEVDVSCAWTGRTR